MCKCVIRLDWKVLALSDKVSNSCCFVIAVFFGELILMWLWSPPPPQEGNHGLSLCDQFSGICRDAYMKLTKPLSEWPDAAVSDGEGEIVAKENLQILHIILMCH